MLSNKIAELQVQVGEGKYFRAEAEKLHTMQDKILKE